MDYESPIVIDYENGGDASPEGVIVLPLIVLAVYSVVAGAVAGAAAVVPVIVVSPKPNK